MDLSKYSSEELRQLRSDIDAELKTRRREDARLAQSELKSVAEKYGFSLNELVGATAPKASGKPSTVRFRHPEDPGKVWSGRGRKPVWVKEWEHTGRSLEKLRVA